MPRAHYVKVIRDAAVPLDNAIHRLTEAGHSHALRNTQFNFDQMTMYVDPRPQDREVVFGVLIEEFTKAGWGFGSRTATEEEDPDRPVIAMHFRHPRLRTRMGERPVRPGKIGFEIPMPDPSVPITADLIDYYAEQAANIARGLLAQQVVDEEGKMPGTPGQGDTGFRPPDWQPAVVKVDPRPLNEVFGEEDESE